LELKVTHHLVVIIRVHEIFKFFENFVTLARIKLFSFTLQRLQSEIKLQKFIISWYFIYLDVK